MRAPLALFLGLLLPACGGPDVAALAASEIAITFGATASAPEEVALGESAGGLSVTRAFLNTSAVRLIACDEGVADLALEQRGYDLLGDPPPRELVGTSVTDLCALRIDVAPVRPTPEDIPEAAALYLEGTDADGADFSVVTYTASSLLLEAADGEAFGDKPLIVGLDVSALLAGLPLDAESAEAASAQLDEQLPGAIAVYVDASDDQILDEDETAPVAVVR